MTLGKKASVCLCPSHTLDLSHTARPKPRWQNTGFIKLMWLKHSHTIFFPESHLKNQTFSESKSGQNLNVKFPGMFYGANMELSAPIIQTRILYLFWMEWIVWHLNNAAAGPKLTPVSPGNLLLRSCYIAFNCQINCFGNCSFLLHT